MLRRSTRSSKKPAPAPKTTNQDQEDEYESEELEDPYACDSDDEFIPSPKKNKKPKPNAKYSSNSSSSESDIDDYLQPADKIDLNSSFFRSKDSAFGNIEKKIFSGITVTRLSDSDSTDDDDKVGSCIIPNKVYTSKKSIARKEDVDEIKKSLKEGENAAKLNFQRLQDYTRKIEEAKLSVEQYKAKQAISGTEEVNFEEKININELLAIGEMRKDDKLLNSSSEYSDSEEEDWEEIKSKPKQDERSLLPKKELQITLEMPGTMRKKKGDDLLAAVKRRLNRIRKENQLLIHKVHLLCWIAHGNYVNKTLNDQTMMALGLSMIPSEKSYPSGRIDLSYLEQILKWYKKTMNLNEKVPSKSKSLNELLIEQIDKKEACTKKMLVLIFIIILRALGVQCRLVFSVQVESLRPPNYDLHSLAKDADPKLKKGETSEKIGESKKVQSKKIENKKGEASKKIEDQKDFKSIEKNGGIVTPRSRGTREKSRNDEKTESKKSNSAKVSKTSDEVPEKKSASKSSKNDESKDRSTRTRNASEKNNKEKTKTTEKSSSKTPKNDDTNDRKTRNRKASEKNNNEKTKTAEKTVKQKPTETKAKSQTRSTRSKKVDDEKTQDIPTVSRTARSKSKLSVDSDSTRSKSACSMTLKLDKINENHSKIRSKSTSGGLTENEKIMQLDGIDDSLEEFKGFETNDKSTDMKSFENFYAKMYDQISEGIKTRSLKRIPQLDGASDEPSSSKPNLKKLKETKDKYSSSCKSKRHKTKKSESDSDGYFEGSPSKKTKEEGKKVNLGKLKNKSGRDGGKIDVKTDIMQLIKGRISEQKQVDKSRMVRKRKPVKNVSESEDSDYAPEGITKKHRSDSENEFCPKMKIKQRVQVKKEVTTIKKIKKPKDVNSRKVISSDSEYTEEEVVKKTQDVKKKRGNDTWLEVFLETEEKWISVDVVFGQIHCVNELFSRASHPVSYILAWDNNNYLKDITRRYCQNFNTVTRKLRTDSQWWETSLKPFLGPKNARDKEEDEELDRQQLEKPLPTTISEYKNHPLYALERHLLKFEALYPPNAPPLGFVRNEPVYSRDCVHLCHSREIWLKDAKVVRVGEKPYKIVKARPKYDKLSNTMITDQMLEIFGPWQVEEYDPPTAENGVVPRNAYGNVDLFKPTMLPKKCAHLRLPGLNKVAKKMNIDCATAIVGFDFHGGFSHPVVDGFVVCEEYEDQLVAAWNIEQEELERKEQEKYEARVYGNWKKLIKGLLIKQRLKAKYGFGEEKTEEVPNEVGGKRKSKGPTFCMKKRRVISDSESGDDNK